MTETEQVPVSELVELASLTPAALNDRVYNPIRPDDPDIVADAERLAETIERFGSGGIDALVVTLDDVIVSGHRRRAMLLYLGETHAPVKRLPILSTDPGFPALLVGYNGTRDKDPAVRVREQLVLADPEAAYAAVQTQRAEQARVKVKPLALGHRRARCRISKAKRPFLDAIRREIEALSDYWPLSDRRVHYSLLNDPPLIHASKPGSRYRNNLACYKACCDLLTRARIAGLIPFEAIGDETRPVTTWQVYPNLSPFVAAQVREFLTGYARDLMIGQPNHVEIVGEKMTVEGTIRPVASRFCVPYTIGRGYSSLPPRKDMYDRFVARGKNRLVLLFVTDHDPEGMDIPTSFSHSMRDDFGIEDVHAVRVGLNTDQVRQLNLPPNTEAKADSSRFKTYAATHGRFAYELEAVPPDRIRRWLRDAITSVIDVAMFNRQVEEEKREIATAGVYQREAIGYLQRLTAGGVG